MPTIKELASIVDLKRYNPAIDTTFFPGTKSSYYWSSTTCAKYASSAWLVSFGLGYDYFSNKSNYGYVRAVRAGQGGGLFGDSVISASAEALDFGSTTRGSASATRRVTITNSGTADLEISGVTISGSAAGDFSKISDNCTGRSVIPSGTCRLDLVFSPTASGSRGATLSITGNSSNSPYAIALQGTGREAAASSAGTVRIRVYDGAGGQSLAGATVQLDSDVLITSAEGRAVYGSVAGGSHSLAAAAAGYFTTSRQVAVAAGGNQEFSLGLTPKPVPSGRPVVTDIYSRVFNRNKKAYFLNGDFLLDEFTVTATVDWQGRTPGYVRFITPKGSYNEPSGSREFDMGTDFGPGGRLAAVAVAADGTESAARDAGVEVMAPPGNFPAILINFVSGVNDFSYRFPLIVGINGSKKDSTHPVPEEVPFFGGQEFSYTPKYEIETILSSNGTMTAGLEIYSEVPRRDVRWKTLRKGLKLGNVEIRTSLGGEIKLQYKEDNNTWCLDGSLMTAGLRAKKKFGPYYKIISVGGFPVPVYLKGKVSGELDGRLGITGLSGDGLILDGELEPKVGGKGYGGVGINNILSGEVYAGLSGALLLAFPQPPIWRESRVTFSGGFIGTVLLFKKEIPLFEINKRWPEAAAIEETGLPGYEILYGGGASSGWQPLKRSYGGFGKRMAMAVTPEEENLIPGQSDVFPHSDPELTALADNSILLTWVRDDLSKSDNNRTTIYSSLFGNDQWSAPIAVLEDGTGDFAPAMASLGSGAVLAWQDSKQVLDDAATADDLIAGQEISVAAYNGAWQGAARLTNDTWLDRSPVIAAGGGRAMVAWIANEGNDLLGSADHPNRIRFSLYDGNSWTQAADAGTYNGPITRMALDYDGANAILTFAADTDGDSGTLEDAELFAVTWDGLSWSLVSQLTSDDVQDSVPALARDQNGALHLIWYRGGSFMQASGLDVAGGAAIVNPGVSAGAMDFRLTAGSSGQLFLVWPDTSGGGQDIFVAGYDPGLDIWSHPRQLTETPEMERSLAAALAGDGNLHLVYNRVEIVETVEQVDTGSGIVDVTVPAPGQVDLVHNVADFTDDPAAQSDSLATVPDGPAPGDLVDITMQVLNHGLNPIQNVDVSFYYGDPAAGGTLIGTATLAGPLAGGDAAEVTLSGWQSPEMPFSGVELYAVVDPPQVLEDRDRGNNSLHIPIFQADVAMAGLNWQMAGPNKRIITATVKNQGNVPAGDVRVVFSRDAENAAIIYEETLTNMAVDQQVDIVYEWNVTGEAAQQGTVPLYGIADPDRVIPESDYSNNERLVMPASVAPDPAANLSIADNSIDASLQPTLAWDAVAEAATYDLYLWKAGESRPDTPTAGGLTDNNYTPDLWLDEFTTYNWQVVARNDTGEAEGLVWSFTTMDVTAGDVNANGNVDLIDAILALQVVSGLASPEVMSTADVNDDGRIGLAEAIYILRSMGE